MRLPVAVALLALTSHAAIAGCPAGLTRHERIWDGSRTISCVDGSGLASTLDLDRDGLPIAAHGPQGTWLAQTHLWPAAAGSRLGPAHWDVVQVIQVDPLVLQNHVENHVTLEAVSDGTLAGGIDFGGVAAGELYVAELLPVMPYRAPRLLAPAAGPPIGLYAQRLLPAADYGEANQIVDDLRAGLVPTLRSWLIAHAGGIEP